MNAEAGFTSDARTPWIERAIVAIVPLLAIIVVLLAPTANLTLLWWLTIGCLIYLPIATLWNCRGIENGFWKAIGRSFASIVAMVAGGILGLVVHLMFHREIHFEPILMWAFVGSIASLSASLLFPWFGDASLVVADFFISGI